MRIVSSKQLHRTPQKARPPVPQEKEEVEIPFKERAVTSAIVGASVGTMIGEKAGELSFLGAASFAGYTLGTVFGQGETAASVIGAVAGAGAGLLVERKVLPIGKTVGGAGGFVSGGIIGGVTGSIIAGARSILNFDFF